MANVLKSEQSSEKLAFKNELIDPKPFGKQTKTGEINLRRGGCLRENHLPGRS